MLKEEVMAINLCLIGTLEKKEDKELFTSLLKELCGEEKLKIEDYDTVVKIEVCPLGTIYVSYEEENIQIQTKTDLAGAGYHAYVCRLFDRIIESSEIEFEVEDPCDYFEQREFETLRYAYFYRWLMEIGTYVKESEEQPLCIAWEEEYIPQINKDEFVTMSGPMRKDIFQTLPIETIAERFFIWNNEEKDGLYYRNCAMHLLWKDCVFEFSKMNETTEKTAQMILDYLELAYEKDPNIALPLEAYRILCETLGKEDLLSKAMDSHEVVGYRRKEVMQQFEQFLLPIHGCSEKSYDRASETMYYMSPYQDDGDWKWLVRCSLQPFTKPIGKEELDKLAYQSSQIKGVATIFKENDHYGIFAVYHTAYQTLYVQWTLKKQEQISEIQEIWDQVEAIKLQEQENFDA